MANYESLEKIGFNHRGDRMSELWQTVLGILTSVGVGGAIVCAFSSWLGKIWAQRILAKETSEYKENLERLIKNL